MPELHLRLKHLTPGFQQTIEPFLEEFSRTWLCDLQSIDDGYLLLPEVMMRKHGIFLFLLEEGCRVCREEDATTWEDFLLMNLAHNLAEELNATIRLDGDGKSLEVAPDDYATFDHYVETVLERYDDVVKDMKKYWLYTHRNRSIR